MTSPRPAKNGSPLVLGRISERKFRIAFTYFLTLLENGFELMYPWAIGLAINGLIAGNKYLMLPLVVTWLVHIITGGARQLYDTRLFSGLYAKMAADIVTLQREEGRQVSEINARVEMAEEFSTFLEHEVPLIFAALTGLVGSIILLFFYDIRSGFIMLGLLLPVALINWVMGRRALRLNNAFNDQWEKQVDVIDDGRRRASRLHFGRLAQWRIRLSDADLASWTLSEILTLGAVIFVLISVASQPGALAGDIFASLAYVLRIASGIDSVPGTVQQVGRLIDIRGRIRSL